MLSARSPSIDIEIEDGEEEEEEDDAAMVNDDDDGICSTPQKLNEPEKLI
jgi:hypothetical protein